MWVPEQPLQPFSGCILREVSTEHKFLTDILIFITQRQPYYQGRKSVSVRVCLSLKVARCKNNFCIAYKLNQQSFPSGYTLSASANYEATIAHRNLYTLRGGHIFLQRPTGSSQCFPALVVCIQHLRTGLSAVISFSNIAITCSQQSQNVNASLVSHLSNSPGVNVTYNHNVLCQHRVQILLTRTLTAT